MAPPLRCRAPSDTTGRALRSRPCPCPRHGGTTLKALITGLCALLLLAGGAVAAAATDDVDRRTAKQRSALRSSASTLSFFESRQRLLQHSVHGRVARREAARERRHLAAAKARLRSLRAQRLQRQLRDPKAAICHVFGRFCSQALTVARCESGFDTAALNGQYRGLFQMGSAERDRFGHGDTALAQARAAHRYFVLSGRDWSPWSCKPW